MAIYIYIYADESVPGTHGPVIRPHLKGRNFRYLDRQSQQKEAICPSIWDFSFKIVPK